MFEDVVENVDDILIIRPEVEDLAVIVDVMDCLS